jgi:hypothetical protein
MMSDDRRRWRMREKCYLARETAAKHERIVKEVSRLFRQQGFRSVRCVHARHFEGQATAGERRQLRVRVSHRSQDKRLRFQGRPAQMKIQLSCYEIRLEYVED